MAFIWWYRIQSYHINVTLDAYLLDNGEVIYFIVFNKISEQFLEDVFNLHSFEELVNSGIDSLDESNTSDLNIRLLNIIAHLRLENHGNTQPVKFLFLE